MDFVQKPVLPLVAPDNQFTVTGSADATKLMKFEVDTQTTGFTFTWDVGAQSANRTLAVPALVGNDTIATLATTQTVTGAKTFSAVTNVSNTTSASSATTGSLTVGNGTAATNVGIGGGNVKAGANIDAITFGGATGSFTPTFIGTGGGSAHTYVVQSGQYVKVGKRVDFSINIAISAKDGTMTGPVSIGGLPFAQSAAVYSSFASVLIAYMTGLSLTANYYQIAGYITTSASQIQLLEHGSNLQQGVPPANLAAATQMLFSGSYYTDA